MPPREQKNSAALMLLRRAGTEPVMSMVRVGAGMEMSSALTRMILRNVHLALWSRKEEEVIVLNSTENSYASEQREGAEPALKFVRIATKVPVSKSDRNMWDESVNWEANSKKWAGGLTARTQKTKAPPFVLREVPYDDWRKHYAKDKTGRYRGTKAPAEDCILLPEDEAKWRTEVPHGEDEKSAEFEKASPQLEQVKRSATFT